VLLFSSTLDIDVYLQVSEPATDLALAVAIASSIREQPVPNNMAFVGELGASLGGSGAYVNDTLIML